MLQGFDPLSITLNQISNSICRYVKPKLTNPSFVYCRCYITGCNSSRGNFQNLIEYFLEDHEGYIDWINLLGFVWVTLRYNLNINLKTQIGMILRENEIQDASSLSITDEISKLWRSTDPQYLRYDFPQQFETWVSQKSHRLTEMLLKKTCC